MSTTSEELVTVHFLLKGTKLENITIKMDEHLYYYKHMQQKIPNINTFSKTLC